LERKRRRQQDDWEEIFTECETSKSLREVAANHPQYSYDVIRKHFKRFKEGDEMAATTRRGAHRRIFSAEQEEILAAQIRERRNEEKIPFSRSSVIREAILYYSHLHGARRTRRHQRVFSTGWANGFKARMGFSSQRLIRRNTVKSVDKREQQLKAESFIFAVREAIAFYGDRFVFNMDETACELADAPNSSWGDKGEKDGNSFYTDKPQKNQLTSIPTVSAAGEILPFAWISKGLTDLAIRRADLPSSIISFFSPKGWTNEEVMCQYIERVIFPYTKGSPCALLVDSYAAHWTPMARQVAWNHNVDLIEVPRGQTRFLQPLDISFNGEFKRKRKELFINSLQMSCNNSESLRNVVRRCERACLSVSQMTVLRGWEVFN